MNIEIANRLVQMRKDRGLSQEALAEELGISRQAVSKWERAESSPDTSNLITLAKLYKVSLDELLNTDQEKFESGDLLDEADGKRDSVDMEEKSDSEDDTVVNISLINGIYVKDGDAEVRVGWNGIHIKEDGNDMVRVGKGGVIVDGEDYSSSWQFSGLITLLVAAVYLVLGVVYSAWHPGWLVFFLIPILNSVGTAVKNRNAHLFAFPVLVFAGILTAIIVYGMPRTTWFALILIPIYSEIASMFGSKKRKRKFARVFRKGKEVDAAGVNIDVSFNGNNDDEN